MAARLKDISMLVTIFTSVYATILMSNAQDYDGDYGPPTYEDDMVFSSPGTPLPAYFNFLAASPLPDQCHTTQISESCGDTLHMLMLSKTLPAAGDAGCCGEVIKGAKYCWDAVIKTFESLNQEGYTNLHPWAANTWNTCLKLTITN
ncbi:hypothetical protein MKX03_010484 [Papaver bracteatum]|nr:hypothetical protein MKX03_010484 [Papaver bracteatum]